MERAREYLRARFVSGVRSSGGVGTISPVSGSIVERPTNPPYVPSSSVMKGLRGPMVMVIEFHQTVFQVQIEEPPEARITLPGVRASPFLPSPTRRKFHAVIRVPCLSGRMVSLGAKRETVRDDRSGKQARQGAALRAPCGGISWTDRRLKGGLAPAPLGGAGSAAPPPSKATATRASLQNGL